MAGLICTIRTCFCQIVKLVTKLVLVSRAFAVFTPRLLEDLFLRKSLLHEEFLFGFYRPGRANPDTLTTKNAGRIRDRLVEERPDRRFESAPAEIQRERVLGILCTDLDAPPAHHTL